MNTFVKAKKAVVSLLVAMALLFAALGAAMLFLPKSVSAAEEKGNWKSHNGSGTVLENGLTTFNQSVILANHQNILEMPNRTVTFQMMVNDFNGWSAFVFLDGLTSDTISWNQISWPTVQGGIDKLNHFIYQNGSGQIYPNNVYAVRNVPNFTEFLMSVELHIGTGEGSDFTYMKLNGVELLHENKDESALAYITTKDFPNGCYLGTHINLKDGSKKLIYLSEYNTPVVTSLSDELKKELQLYKADFITKDLTVSVANLKDAASATVEINGAAVDSKYFELKAEGTDKATLTIHKEFWADTKFAKDNYLTVTSGNGSAVVVLNVAAELAPVWSGENFTVIDEIKDVSYKFKSMRTGLTAETIAVKSSIYSGFATQELTAGTDYTLSAGTASGEQTEYTLTIKKEYLEGVLGDYFGRYFTLTIGDNTINASLYYRQAEEGWIARKADLAEGTKLTDDGYYVKGTFNRLNVNALSSRLYYNKGLDVTKPIVFEFGTIPSTTEWAMLQVADSLKTMDYFSDGYKAESELQLLFFGKGRTDIQKFHGVNIGSDESTNAYYTASPAKSVVVELFFGAEKASDGYIRVNGSSCGTPTSTQKDFEGGKAYIGWFLNDTAGNYEFKVSSKVNSVAIKAPLAESDYKMDLAKAADLKVTLINAGAELTVTDQTGKTLVKDTDYSYDAAKGELTFKAAYFSGLTFSKTGTISIKDNASQSGTQFTMSYSSSNMQTSSVAFASVGGKGDVTFELSAASVDVLLNSKGEEVAKDFYSFASGKLTIKNAVLPLAKAGVTEFMAISGQALYPCYVYVEAFENGGSKVDGSGSVTANNGKFTMKGDLSYVLMQTMSFEKGVAFAVDFKSIPGYYENGTAQGKSGSVTFDFYDPYSGNTLHYTLYANFEDSKVSDTKTALSETYSMTNSEGQVVILPVSRTLNISKGENPSALGRHEVIFTAANGGITVKVDDARATSISSLNGFNVSAAVCTVSVPAGAEGKDMLLDLNYYEGNVVPEPTPDPDPTPDPKPDPTPDPKPEEQGGGCAGEIGFASTAILSVAALGACVCVIALRKKNVR